MILSVIVFLIGKQRIPVLFFLISQDMILLELLECLFIRLDDAIFIQKLIGPFV